MKDTFFYYLRDKRALAAVLALLLATIGLSFLLLSTVPVIQEAFPPEEGELDLRGKHLTVDQYLRLQETNPDREIRWNVPVGSETFDSFSETLTLSGYTAPYADGATTRYDMPALLSVAAGYEFTPKLRATLEYHFFDDKNAKMAGDRQKELTRGTHEILAGVE